MANEIGGAGGSGVVIVRYTNPTQIWSGGRVTQVGGDWVHTFNNSGQLYAGPIVPDQSGNGNDWIPNNISTTAGPTYDVLTDVPTLTNTNTANYATLNPLNRATQVATSSGNLIANFPANNWTVVPATMAFGGKVYCEFTLLARNQADVSAIGILIANQDVSQYLGAAGSRPYEWSWQGNTTFISNNNVSVATGLPTYAVNDVISFAFDAVAGNWWVAKNGAWVNSGNPATNTNPTVTGLTNPNGYVPACFGYTASGTQTQWSFNAGQQAFAFTPPAGFVAVNTNNLPTPAVNAGNPQMDVTLYNGTATTAAIVNAGRIQPDLVWIKNRSASASHALYDSARGPLRTLSSDTISVEQSLAGTLTSFNNDGFSVGAAALVNTLNNSYSAWQWRASGAAVVNTAGSITSQVSTNPTAGFSIVSYTGAGGVATVGHGLGAAPAFVIVKCRTNAISAPAWPVWHSALVATNYLDLQTTISQNTATSIWNSLAPSATVLNIGTSSSVNTLNFTYIAYCFAPVAGYSAFGSYTGNGSSDGPFIYTGFRPKWIMIKAADRSPTNWDMTDTARSGFNPTSASLDANLPDMEYAGYPKDILSNGFKIRENNQDNNNSGSTYIYAAFAENPLQYATAR